MMTKSNHLSTLHRGGILRAVLYDCSSLNSLDQFTEIVLALGETSDLIYLGDPLTLNGEVGHTAIEENQINSFIGDKYEQSKIRI